VPATNVELARRAFEAIATDGLAAALDFLDPEIEFEPPEEALEQRGTFTGHQAVKDRWNLLLEPFDDVRMELDEVIEASDETVLVVFRIHARGKASGVPVDMRLAHLVTVREGKAVRMRAYLDPAEARRAVGLDPQPG
jgi:ketosteroid isomerase-like protein